MPWPVWSKVNQLGLAQYVRAEVANPLRLACNRQDLLARGERSRLTAEIFDALARLDIRYSRPPFNPDLAQQIIRGPDSLLDGSGDGTCLDLALLFAGAALGNDLLPLVVVLNDHALVAVAMDHGRLEADAGPRVMSHGAWVRDGALRDVQVLRNLVDDGHFVFVECTGFAASQAIPPALPEGRGRIDGRMNFARAVEAGREQLEHAGRELRFAIDVAYLQDIGRLVPFDPFGQSVDHLRPQLRQRLTRIFDAHQIFGGRDEQLALLDDSVADPNGGYRLITGDSGSGKTALLANWIRGLEARERPVAYHFLSRQYDTAGREEMLLSLVQQLRHWYGRSGIAGGSGAELEAEYLDLIANPPQQPLVIVVDGLDEAQGWSVGPQLFPSRLPDGLHVVVSARSIGGRDWQTELELTNVLHMELGPLTEEGVAQVLRQAGAPEWVLEAKALAALNAAARGDPFYLRVLVDDILAGRATDSAQLAAHPKGVDAYLQKWWEEIQESTDQESVADLLGYLLVARGPIARGDLVEISDSDKLTGFSFDPTLNRVRRFVVGDAEQGFALCHWRFQDYLARRVLGATERAIYRDRLVDWCTRWRDHTGAYAIAYHAAHRFDLLAEGPVSERTTKLTAIVDLVCDVEYQARRLQLTEDIVGLQADAERALAEVALLGAEAPPYLLARAALEVDQIRDVWLRAEAVFDLAQHGRIEEAERRLALFQTDSSWRDAATLIVAWHGAASRPSVAQAVITRFSDGWHARAPLPLLRARVAAALDGLSPPDMTLPYFPGTLPAEPPPPIRAEFIVARMGAEDSPEGRFSGLEGFEPLHAHGEETPTYIAEGDSPSLVAFAIADPAAGTDLLRQYIGIHAGNPYADYRNRSLWAILGAVLCNPDDAWAREMSTLLASAALAPSPVRFRGGFRISVLACQARAGVASAAAEFRTVLDDAVRGGRQIVDGRGNSNRWSHYTRSYSVLAEALARGCGAVGDAEELLDDAASLPFGFAGFHAPACLHVAEANLVVRPHPGPASDAMEAALTSAHNVQDPSFCARTTARVNVMRSRWWPTPIPDFEETVAPFVQDPTGPLFAPIHVVGDPFERRPPARDRIPVDDVTQAHSLADLASRVFHVSVASLERLNPTLPPADYLPTGTQVAIADPAFVPLLAARFAAEAVALPGLDNEARARILSRLVPMAAIDSTALDAVLCRRILADPPSATELDRLLVLAPPIELDQTRAGGETMLAAFADYM
jgi:hypothetical protein